MKEERDPSKAEPSRPPWRPAVKRGEIVGALRQDLIEGRYAPGSRLPTRTELIDRFDVSSVTVQQAVDRLKRDGFVISRGRRGTFVTDYPPHLHHYGLVFSGDPLAPSEPQRSLFWLALYNQAVDSDWADRRTRIWTYRHLGSGSRSADYARLVADVNAQRLAGLILADPWSVRNWVRDLPVPVVGFTRSDPIDGNVGTQFSAVDLNASALGHRAMDYLVKRKVRRVAFLLGRAEKKYFDELRVEAAERGLELRPEWVQSVNPQSPYWARHNIVSIFRGPASERPEGLVITDDTLLDSAAEGLREVGVRVPEDLCVVAHANFPLAEPATIPAVRLGFSARQTLQVAMETINRFRRGEHPPAVTLVTPVFESELSSTAVEEMSHT